MDEPRGEKEEEIAKYPGLVLFEIVTRFGGGLDSFHELSRKDLGCRI